jgi:uncharacterized protein YndB with AHSA1/START domain
VTDEASTVVEREIHIAARPETVFAFFTDPLKLLQWIGKEATVEARPGGMFRIDMNGRDIVRGQFVEVTPYSRIVFTWGYENDRHAMPPGSTTVEVSLIPDGDGTLVRLRHSELPENAREAHETGWAHYLLRLRAVAEGEDPGPDSMAEPTA